MENKGGANEKNGSFLAEHPKTGLASLVIGILSAGTILFITNYDYDIKAQEPADTVFLLLFFFLLYYLCVFASMVGIGLGVAGSLQKTNKRILARVGLSINSVIVLIILGKALIKKVFL